MNLLVCRIVFFFKLINDKFLLCDIKIYKLLCGFLNERKNVKINEYVYLYILLL